MNELEELWRRWWWLRRVPHRHHHKVFHVVIYVGDTGVVLRPNQETIIMQTVTVGHTIAMSIGFLDTRGNPMLAPPALDSAPVWTGSSPATETLTPAADGLSCAAAALAAGTDTITVAAVVGGQTFSATLDVTVQAAPQTLGSIVIKVDGVS